MVLCDAKASHAFLANGQREEHQNEVWNICNVIISGSSCHCWLLRLAVKLVAKYICIVDREAPPEHVVDIPLCNMMQQIPTPKFNSVVDIKIKISHAQKEKKLQNSGYGWAKARWMKEKTILIAS